MRLLDVADVDRPGVRGATVKVALREDPLWDILSAERTGDGRLVWHDPDDASRQYAAEKLRDDSALADGLRQQDRLTLIGVTSAPGSPTQAMLDAQERLRGAWLAVRGPENNAAIADIVRCVVLGRSTLAALETARRTDGRTARRGLIAGLDRLVDYFGC